MINLLFSTWLEEKTTGKWHKCVCSSGSLINLKASITTRNFIQNSLQKNTARGRLWAWIALILFWLHLNAFKKQCAGSHIFIQDQFFQPNCCWWSKSWVVKSMLLSEEGAQITLCMPHNQPLFILYIHACMQTWREIYTFDNNRGGESTDVYKVFTWGVHER